MSDILGMNALRNTNTGRLGQMPHRGQWWLQKKHVNFFTTRSMRKTVVPLKTREGTLWRFWWSGGRDHSWELRGCREITFWCQFRDHREKPVCQDSQGIVGQWINQQVRRNTKKSPTKQPDETDQQHGVYNFVEADYNQPAWWTVVLQSQIQVSTTLIIAIDQGVRICHFNWKKSQNGKNCGRRREKSGSLPFLNVIWNLLWANNRA